MTSYNATCKSCQSTQPFYFFVCYTNISKQQMSKGFEQFVWMNYLIRLDQTQFNPDGAVKKTQYYVSQLWSVRSDGLLQFDSVASLSLVSQGSFS